MSRHRYQSRGIPSGYNFGLVSRHRYQSRGILIIPAAIVSFCFHFCSFENHAERPYKLWIMDVVGLIRVDLFLFSFSHLNVWILFGKLSVFPWFFFGGLVDVFSVVVFLGFFIWGRGEQSLTSFDPLRGVCVCVNPWNIGIGTHMRTFRSTAGGHGSIHQSVANEATDVWRGYAVWSTARTCYSFFFMFSVLGMTGVMVRNMLYVRLYSPRLCSTN